MEAPKVEAYNGTDPSRLYTKLKFIRSDRNDNLIGFVSINTLTGRVKGVREDSTFPKKICVVDKALQSFVKENVLYDCELEPMMPRARKSKAGKVSYGDVIPGYIVIDAKPVQFKATIEMDYRKGKNYCVKVKFGNKILRFNPYNSKHSSAQDVASFKALLEERQDIKDLAFVIADFEEAAAELLAHLKRDEKQRQWFADKAKCEAEAAIRKMNRGSAKSRHSR